MIYKTLLLLLFAGPLLFAQKTTEDFPSEKLKQSRSISILTPPSYESNKNKKYPLLLLLDGEYLFDPFAGTMSYTNYWDDLPEVIIVGINHKDKQERTFDTQSGKETGLPEEQGNKFFEFITMELLPQLEKKYRIAPFKIIAGHDQTAGYLNFFLYKEDPAFNAYIAFSPELATEMESHLPERLAAQKKQVFYYLATAEGDVKKLQKSTKALNDSIKAVKNDALRYHFDDFGNASHYSLVAFGVPSAMYHIFSSYQPISANEYQTKLSNLTSGYTEYLEKRYDGIAKDMGVKMPVRINDFKAVEAAIIKNAAYDDFKELASLAKKNYPKATIGEYYMAMYYEKTGDTKKAIKTYLNSYTFNEIGDYTKDMMLDKAEQLKGNSTE